MFRTLFEKQFLVIDQSLFPQRKHLVDLNSYYIFDRLNYGFGFGRLWFDFVERTPPLLDNGTCRFFYKGSYEVPPRAPIKFDPKRFFIESDTSNQVLEYTVRHDPTKFTLMELNKKILDIETKFDKALISKARSASPRRTLYQFKSLNEHVYPCTFDEIYQIKKFNLKYNAYIQAFDIKLRHLTSKYIKFCIQFQQNEIEKKRLYKELHTYLPFVENFKKQPNMLEISDLCIKILGITRINNIIKDKFYAYQEIISYFFFKMEEKQGGLFFKQRYDKALDGIAFPISPFMDFENVNTALKLNEEIYKYRTTNLVKDLFDLQHSPIFIYRKSEVLLPDPESLPPKSEKLSLKSRKLPLKSEKLPLSNKPAKVRLSQKFYNKLYSTHIINYLKNTKLEASLDYPIRQIANNFYPKLLDPMRGYPNYDVNFALKQYSLYQSFIFYSLSALCKLTNLPHLSSVELMVQKYGYPVGELFKYKEMKKVVQKEIFDLSKNYNAHQSKWLLVHRVYEQERIKHLREIQTTYVDRSIETFLKKEHFKPYEYYFLEEFDSVSLTFIGNLKYMAHRFNWWLFQPSRSLRHIYLSWRMDITTNIEDECNNYIDKQNRGVVFDSWLQRSFYNRSFLKRCDEVSRVRIIEIMDEFIMKDKKFDINIKKKVKNHLLAGGNLESLLEGYGDNEVPDIYQQAFRLAEEYAKFTGFNKQTEDILRAMEHDRWLMKYKNAVTHYSRGRRLQKHERNVL